MNLCYACARGVEANVALQQRARAITVVEETGSTEHKEAHLPGNHAHALASLHQLALMFLCQLALMLLCHLLPRHRSRTKRCGVIMCTYKCSRKVVTTTADQVLSFIFEAHEARERITFVRLRYVCGMGSASAAAVGSSPLLPRRATAPVDDAFCFSGGRAWGQRRTHTQTRESSSCNRKTVHNVP